LPSFFPTLLTGSLESCFFLFFSLKSTFPSSSFFFFFVSIPQEPSDSRSSPPPGSSFPSFSKGLGYSFSPVCVDTSKGGVLPGGAWGLCQVFPGLPPHFSALGRFTLFPEKSVFVASFLAFFFFRFYVPELVGRFPCSLINPSTMTPQDLSFFLLLDLSGLLLSFSMLYMLRLFFIAPLENSPVGGGRRSPLPPYRLRAPLFPLLKLFFSLEAKLLRPPLFFFFFPLFTMWGWGGGLKNFPQTSLHHVPVSAERAALA